MRSSATLLKEYFEKLAIEERGCPTKHLRIFDFDDTLVKTASRVHITRIDGSKFDLVPAAFAAYDAQPGDVFDYTDFTTIVEPRSIKWTNQILHRVYAHHGPAGVSVLTARGSPEPISQYMSTMNIVGLDVIALGTTDPGAKAAWIDQRIRRDNLQLVEFFDDSIRNVSAVRELRNAHPDVKIIGRHVIHNRIRRSLTNH
jgi:hypothetical protein